MARRQDKDFIDSLKMIGLGDPNYPASEKEKQQMQRETETEKPVS